MRVWKTFAPLLCCVAASGSGAESHWPQFRGSNGLGIAGGGAPPVHFGPTSNVLWKAPLSAGNSSPCVWGQRIFITGCENGNLETVCLDRQDGRIRWRQRAPAEKIERVVQRLGNPATPTPATDGKSVFVYFGSFGLLCYDQEGREQWRKPLPAPVVEFGASTSPIIAGDLLILNCDQDLDSFLLAVDRRTGRQVWKTERPEFRRGFATPFLWRHDNEEELIVPGSIWLKSYNPKDGSERWTFGGTSRVACSSPVGGDGLLFSASWNVGGDEGDRLSMPPFDEALADYDKNKDGKLTQDELPPGPVRERFTQIDLNKDGVATREEWTEMAAMFAKAGNALLAIRPGGRGDITRTHLAWKQTRSLPYVSSPLYYQDRLFTIKNGGLVSCYEAKTGRALYQDERLGAMGDYYASAVAVDGKAYIASEQGVVVVFDATEDTLNVLARNNLAEAILATPAIVDGKIYLRTATSLYAFGF